MSNRGPDPLKVFGMPVRKARKKPPKKAKLAAPGLTERDLNSQVKASTQFQFGPQERTLQGQAARIPDWYSQYAQSIQAAGARAAAANAQAVQGVQGLQSGINTASQQQWAGQNQQMTQDAASRGATVDPNLANQAHGASDVRNMLTGSFGAQLINQGAVAARYFADQARIGAQQGIEALGRNAGQMSELGKQKGEYQAKARRDIIGDAVDADYKAQDSAFKQFIQAQQLGQGQQRIKLSANQQATERYDKQQRRQIARKNSDISQQNADTSKYRATHPQKGKGKDAFGNTPKQRTAAQDSWDRTYHMAKTYGPHVHSEQELYDFLVQSKDVNDAYARAAAQAFFHKGRLGPKTRRGLAHRGVTRFPKPEVEAQGGGTATPVGPDGRRT